MKNAPTYLFKLLPVCCCIFFMPLFNHAQTRGKVEVVKDPLIDTLIAKRAAIGKTVLGGEAGASGFRVQIYFGSSRQAAYDAQAKFMNEYPEIPTYISYTEPNFRVQAGDFHSRLEAQKLQSQLSGMFPSIFIIPTKISPPKSDSE